MQREGRALRRSIRKLESENLKLTEKLLTVRSQAMVFVRRLKRRLNRNNLAIQDLREQLNRRVATEQQLRSLLAEQEHRSEMLLTEKQALQQELDFEKTCLEQRESEIEFLRSQVEHYKWRMNVRNREIGDCQCGIQYIEFR